MILAGLALAVSAPSFDCKKASTRVEKMICADPRLAAGDRAIAKLYAGVPRSDARARRVHKDWLMDRSKCQDTKCIIESQEAHLFNLFPDSKTPRSDYRIDSKANPGSLSILSLGNDWYAFGALKMWVGSVARGEVNTAEASGVYKLVDGRAARAPTSERDCGWKIQRLPHDRWKLESWPGSNDDPLLCGGWNATVTGVYSR